MLREIALTPEQYQAALDLHQGEILIAYQDGRKVFVELMDGDIPYQWIDNHWVLIRPHTHVARVRFIPPLRKKK